MLVPCISMTGLNQCVQISPQDQAAIFFGMLTHDDHNSNYVVSRLQDGSWVERAYRAEDLTDLRFDPNSAYYITRNGFTGRHRRVQDARQVNALMFDIDCHGKNPRASVPLVIAALSNAFATASLPLPSLQVDTGRGVQLYYVLQKATPCRTRSGAINAKGLDYVHDVEMGLSERLKRLIAHIPAAQVDESVYDLARVGRIPGTWNPKAKCNARLIGHSFAFHTLASLLAYRHTPAPQSARPKTGRMIVFDRLMTLRLTNVENLQKLRNCDCHGSRESLCFVHYNTATQIYGPDAAFAHTLAFNARFTHPLPEADIAQIKRSVDNVTVVHGKHKGEKGFYPLSLQSLIEKLRMTQEEAYAAGFFSSSRQLVRAQAKQDTTQRRDKRNQAIVALCSSHGFTQKAAADHVGCSVRTVASVMAAWRAQNTKDDHNRVLLKDLAAAALKACTHEHAKKCPTSWSVVPTHSIEKPLVAFQEGPITAYLPFYLAKNTNPIAPGPIWVPNVLPKQVASRCSGSMWFS